MTRKLSYKLYVWEGVLRDWTDGVVCVLAVSKVQALATLKKEDPRAWEECQHQDPKVHTKPAAVCVRGGG
jgi:hypothetical protein